MSGEAVKVAVRVRPFNQREKDRKAKVIIDMQGQMTTIKNPEAPNEKPKQFSFDFSYWSHDGFEVNADGISEPTPGSKYASQRRVFEDLGQGVLNNAFEGYNCSLFAYGQTGSGKSYSMVGYGPNRGIVPITCDELFQAVTANKNENMRYQIAFSMLEIYNEQVRDLLSKENPKGGLPVRENPKLGLFYVQGLKQVPVGSYAEIEKRMEQGTASRTVASTNMNATSSRAHTVVTITFDQIIKQGSGGDTKKSSVINLVDLAGSERADSTGATGDRLKEGANINKSLSALGNVISSLADQSTGKKKVRVPYRDSVLTKLLQNALGGNSKTIMIAALSPADINFDETLGTLRYADRAKKIKNKAVINENPMEKLIRELKAENDKLKKDMESGLQTARTQGLSSTDVEKMRREMEEEIRAQLLANQEMLAGATGEESWEEKLQLARSETTIQDNTKAQQRNEPHLVNLNEDPMLSGVIVHPIEKGETTIGRKDQNKSPKVVLNGLSILKNHAVITCKGNEVDIKPGEQGAKIKVNGVPLTGPRVLEHKDRILFGSNHLYVYNNPKNPKSAEDVPDEITWDFAQKEIAQAKGFATGGAGLSKDQQIAQEQVLEILPLVSEVNAISEELNKHRTFEVVLISSAAQEAGMNNSRSTKVMVKMKNLLNENTWLWERGKFMNRRYLMQDLYQRWLDGEEDVSKIHHEEDPFWEPTEDVLIGTANVFLQSLAYALDFDDKLTVTDYKGLEEGSLYVTVAPCNQQGRPLDEDYFVDDPQEMIGKPFSFKVMVRSAEVNKARFSKGLRVRYRVYNDPAYVETDMIAGTLSPEFNHSKVVSFPKLTQDLLDFFESGCITFLLYGKQEDAMPEATRSKMTTKELRQMEHVQNSKPNMQRRNTIFGLDSGDQSQLKSELMLLQHKYKRLEQKERRMQEICKQWATKPEEEKQFDPFYKVVSAVANSTGTRLRTRVQVLNKMLRAKRYFQDGNSEGNSDSDSDTISLYVFGDDEDQLAKEANQNDGIISYDKVADHYPQSSQRFISNGGKSPSKGKLNPPSGPKKEGSRACVIQ